jgi:hypothetical protein
MDVHGPMVNDQQPHVKLIGSTNCILSQIMNIQITTMEQIMSPWVTILKLGTQDTLINTLESQVGTFVN